MSNDFNVQLEKLIPLIDELSIRTNEIGLSFHGKYGREIKLKGFVYLDLMQRINANLEALLLLLKKFKESPELKSPIAILLRACLSDVLTGYYLYTFMKDKVTFENEVKVLGLDYASYMISMIENELKFTSGNLSVSERQSLMNKRKKQIADKYPDLIKSYDEQSGKVVKYKRAEIRDSSNPKFFFSDKQKNNPITDISKYDRLLKFQPLRDLAYVYVLMRFYAQFQHYAFFNRDVNLLDSFDNFKFMVQSFYYITGAIHSFGSLIDADESLLNEIDIILNSYKGLKGLSKKK